MRRIACFFIIALCLAGAQARELILQAGHADHVVDLAFSSKGDRVLTASYDGSAKLWDRSSGKVLQTYRVAKEKSDRGYLYTVPVSSVDLSSDGRTLVTLEGEQTVAVREISSGKVLKTYSLSSETGERGGLVRFFPDGKTILATSFHKSAFVLGSGKEQTLSFPADVTSLDIAPQGDAVLIGLENETAQLVDLASGKVTTLSHPSGRGGVSSVAFSPEGKHLVCGTQVNWLQVWTREGQLVTTVEGSSHALDAKQFQAPGYSMNAPTLRLDFDQEGRLWTSDGGGETRAWSFPELKVLSQKELDFPTSLVRTGGGQIGAVGSRHFAQVWNDEQDRQLGGRADTVYNIYASDRTQQLVLGTYSDAFLWDAAAGKPVRSLEGYTAAFSPDGSRWAVAQDQAVKVYDKAGQELLSIPVERRTNWNRVTGLTFSTDSTKLAFAYGRKIQVWDATKKLAELEDTASITQLLFLPDNTLLSAGGSSIRYWDLRWRKMMLERKTRRASYLQVAADSERLYAFGNEGGRYWSLYDIDDKGTDVPLGLHHQVNSIALSPGGRRLFVGTEDVIEVYDTSTMTKLEPLEGHLDGVTHMAFLNGKLLSSSRDTSVRVWDFAKGQHLGELVAFDQGAQWVVTSPQGLFDGSASGMGMLEWRIDGQAYALEQFFESAYTPGLLHRLLEGKTSSRTQTVAAKPPVVRFTSPANGEVVDSTELDLAMTVEDGGSGWSDLKLFHNGHRVGDVKGEKASVVLVPGLNRFRVTASSSSGEVESRADEIVVMCQAKVADPVLHVVTVGIDKYNFPAPLEFARKDAQALASRLEPGVFSQVKVYSVSDKDATKEAISERFRQVAQAARPQDGCLVYLAGHGVTVEGRFFFLPSDADLKAVATSGLSSQELGKLLSEVPATKQVLILDTCHSGATVGELAGVLSAKVSSAPVSSMVKDQHRLARNAGVFLVAASTPDEKAQEIPQLGHGLLTYTILSGLDSKVGQASAEPNGEGYVTMNNLLRFVSEQVPLLSEKYRGAPQEVWQFSAGQDFALLRAR